MTEPRYIPFNRPDIGDEEIGEVVDTLRSGWLTTGERTHRFEAEFREYTGARHALALSSGTAALHLPLVALGIGPGDEVITTPLTFCATVASIIHVGATPVLADVLADGNVDPHSVAQRITASTDWRWWKMRPTPWARITADGTSATPSPPPATPWHSASTRPRTSPPRKA